MWAHNDYFVPSNLSTDKALVSTGLMRAKGTMLEVVILR